VTDYERAENHTGEWRKLTSNERIKDLRAYPRPVRERRPEGTLRRGVPVR
jgi:hypothetical protein